MDADTLFYNGNFFSPFYKRKVNWLAVKDGWIVGVGEGAFDRHLWVRKKINLNKNYILPGWIDAHVHLMLLGSRKFEVDVGDCFSFDSLKKTLLRRKQETWIEAYGFDLERWKESTLTAHILDHISSQVPLLIRQKDEH